MWSAAVLYMVAVSVVSSARSSNALPLYPDSAFAPQEELLQKLVAEVEEGRVGELGEQKNVKHALPFLLQEDRDRDAWSKGAKETLQQEKLSNVVDDLKAAVLKLAGADNLRSHGFLRSEQSLPKNNKRACFWKYCVTN